MYSLSNKEINHVVKMVDNAEITFSHLRDDLIDHLCCDIENEIDDGKDFQNAYEKVSEKAGLRGLKQIQEDTLLLINKRYRFMKNTMKIFGIVTLILLALGATCKIFHWPGASIMLTLGFFFMVAVFFPATIWVLRKEAKFEGKTFFAILTYLAFSLFMVGVLFKVQHWPGSALLLVAGLGLVTIVFLPYLLSRNLRQLNNKKQKTIYIVGYASLIIYIIGFVFKLMHWPGAAIMLILGSISLTTVFLPVYAYNKFKETRYVSAQFIFLSIAIVYFNMFTLLLALRVSTNIMHEFVKTNTELKKQNTALDKMNADAWVFLNDSLAEHKRLMNECRYKTDSLINFIEDIKLGLIQFADGVNKEEAKYLLANQENIADKTNIKMVHFMMFGQDKSGYAYELKDALQEYNLFVRNNFREVAKKEGLLDLIDTSDRVVAHGVEKSWEDYFFLQQNVMNAISNLSILQQNIQLIEYELLQYARHKLYAQRMNPKNEEK